MSIPTRIHFLNSNLNNTKVSDKQNEGNKYNNRVNFKLLVNAHSKDGEHIADFTLTTSIK